MINAVAFAPRGTAVAVGGARPPGVRCALRQCRDAKPRTFAGHAKPVLSLAFNHAEIDSSRVRRRHGTDLGRGRRSRTTCFCAATPRHRIGGLLARRQDDRSRRNRRHDDRLAPRGSRRSERRSRSTRDARSSRAGARRGFYAGRRNGRFRGRRRTRAPMASGGRTSVSFGGSVLRESPRSAGRPRTHRPPRAGPFRRIFTGRYAARQLRRRQRRAGLGRRRRQAAEDHARPRRSGPFRRLPRRQPPR